MADITLQHITPRHFYETVKLIKEHQPDFRFAHNALMIKFDSEDDLFNRIEHLQLFLQELVNSSVPVDLDEFIKKYRYYPKSRFFRR